MSDTALQPLMVSKERAALVLETSVSNFEAMVRAGLAPKGRLLGRRGVRWLYREIEAFALSLPIADLPPPVGSGHGRAGKPNGD